MNIWIFNHYATGPGKHGGTRHFDLGRQACLQGHKVTIFASSFSYQSLLETVNYKKGENYREQIFDGVRFIWLKTTPYKTNNIKRVLNMISYSLSSYKIGRKIKEKPDVIIGSLVHPLAALVGYLLSKKKGSIFYFEERDLWPQTLIDLGKVSKYNPVILMLSWLEKYLYNNARRIVVLFDNAVDYVKSRGINPNKVVCLPNGIDFTRYHDDKNDIPENLKNTLNEIAGKFIAIYLGSHGKANNLDVVLDAAKKLSVEEHIHFLFVGDGPEKGRLTQRKIEEGIDNVTFYPSIKKEFVPVLLKRVQLGLLPLVDSPVFKWGISPNKLFDYMASELPVILLCNLDGTPVEKSGGGFVIKDNYCKNLAMCILQLSQNREKTRIMGRKAREYVEQHHSWERLSNQFLSIMEQDNGKV